jgi:uncharacterized protein YbjQ (UPF0145 family)
LKLFGFGGGSAPDPAKQARDEASQESIRNGGLPLNAIDRLSEQRRREQAGKPFFTSDLSPSELLLTHECGFVPVGQVMGSCIYHVGWQFVNQSFWGYGSQEMATLTQSQYDARILAFSRLRQEAKLLGADGVVGVRFTRTSSDFSSQDIEFMAIGTAVRRLGAPPLPANREPFVSNLSGQDHWMLRRAGMAPLGFVFGTCAWYQYPDWRTGNAMMSWSNVELTSLSQGLYTARELAMDRMEAEGRSLAARGVVGVTFETHHEHLEQSQNNPGGFIMHFTAWGTAIGPDPVYGTAPGANAQRIDIDFNLPIGPEPT